MKNWIKGGCFTDKEALPKRVLVIEHDDDVKFLIRESFRLSTGYAVVTVSYLREAVSFLRTIRFALIISEYHTPERARALFEILRGMNLDTPIVFFASDDVPNYEFRDIEYDYTTVARPHAKELLKIAHEILG